MITATVSNQAVSIFKDSLSGTDKINEQTDFTFTVIDLTGTLTFTKNQPVELVDDALGTRFAGYINNQPAATVLYPNPARMWSLDCRDQTWLAQKRTTNKSYAGQYAGTILVDMVQRYGSIEGLWCHAALGWFELLTEWQNGTMSGTLATTNATDGNVGDGDLELALAGSQVTFLQASQADFSGSAGGLTATPNGVTFTPTPAIKLQATQNIPGITNAYTGVKIWDSTVASYTIPTTYPTLFYDMWIASTSPQQMAGIELVCSDGTSFLSQATNWDTDAQGIGPGISNDLSGLATDQWYSRALPLYGVGSLGGKTLQSVSVAFGGSNQGTYTAYFRNIRIAQYDGVTNLLTVFSTTATSIALTPQQLRNNGYVSMVCALVAAYERHGFMYSTYFSLAAAGIARSSYVSWDIVMPTINTSSFTFTITATLDGSSTFLPCVQNGAIPGLMPGMSLAGKYVLFAYVFDNAGPDPTQTPYLTRVAGSITPAAAASKSDVINTTSTATGWTGGTLTNLVNTSGNALALLGAARNWDDANFGNQTLFGASGAAQGMLDQQFYIQLGAAGQANSRLDFSGNWQNFILEVDVKVETASKVGVAYRTTAWSNADANYAYAVELTTAGIFLQRGSNSSSSSTGTRTQLATTALTLNSGDVHRLKLAISGSIHNIYLDDVNLISKSDGTYSAAGGISLRSAPSAAYTQYFNNFGIVASLAGNWVSPAIDIHSLGTISNSQLLLQIDPAVNTSICTFLAEISLNNGSTWTSLPNISATPGYFQALPVAGLSPGANVSSLTQVRLRLTISTTTAATGATMPDLTAVTLWAIGAYSSSGVWSTVPLAWDSAQRSNVVGSFGTATNGATYIKNGTATTNLTGNELIISATTGDVHMQISGTNSTDEMATIRFKLAGSIAFGLELRYVNSSNYYRLSASTSAISIAKANGGSPVTLASAASSLSTGAWYNMCFVVVGAGPIALLGRVWPDDGSAEPTTWNVTAND